MPLSINGRISLEDIKNEFGDPDGDGQFKFSEYYRGDSSSKPVKNISRNSNIATTGEIRASQFYGSAGLDMGGPTTTDTGWPGDNEYGVPGPDIPGTGVVNHTWDTQQDVLQNFGTPECFCWMDFKHEVANSRIRIRWSAGNSANPSTIRTGYQKYVGLETATWTIKYQATTTVDISVPDYLPWGPVPADNNLTDSVEYSIPSDSYRFFGWLAQATTARPFARVSVANIIFTLKAELGTDTFTSQYSPTPKDLGDIVLMPAKSNVQVPGGSK